MSSAEHSDFGQQPRVIQKWTAPLRNALGAPVMRGIADARSQIGDKIAMINIADGFGVDLANAARKAA